MEKEILENKLKAEQETKDTEIVELKDDDMSTITAGSGIHDSITQKLACYKNKVAEIQKDARESNNTQTPVSLKPTGGSYISTT
ncbi:MAG: hypothetical protein MJ250_09895 [Alphaproteobacteria bacterium]|nr:hypothetical protein [Alphaproteobacteria bacterium]